MREAFDTILLNDNVLYSHIENNELNSLCSRACLLISRPLWLEDFAKAFPLLGFVFNQL